MNVIVNVPANVIVNAIATAIALAALLVGAAPTPALADQPANRPILGPEAAALAGAYGALAEDASAVIYNPAGAAFAPHPWSTASQQAYGETTYVFPGGASNAALKITMSETPTFVGFTAKDPRWTAAWAVAAAAYEDGAVDYTFDSDVRGELGEQFSGVPGVSRYETVQRSRAHGSHQHLAVAVARPLGERFAVGLTAELARARTSFQDTLTSTFAFTDPHGGPLVSHTLSQRDRDAEGRLAGGTLGVLALLDGGWRLGASVGGGRYVWQKSRERSSNARATLTPDGEPGGFDDGQGNKILARVSFDAEEARALRPFDAPPPAARLAAAHVGADGGKLAADLTLLGYAKADDLRLHPTLNAAVGKLTPLAPAWRLDLGLATAFDQKRAQTAHGMGAAADYVDDFALSTGLVFRQDDFRVTGLMAFGYGIGRSTYTDGDGSEHRAKVSQRRWQTGIAFANWR